MAFSISIPTRHTDTFAATGFVHAGVLLGLTEMAYAAYEQHVGMAKPSNVVSVQRETRATYKAPLGWQEGATIEVQTTAVSGRNFTQEFTVRSTASGRMIATIVHDWAWLDTETGRGLEIDAESQRKLTEN